MAIARLIAAATTASVGWPPAAAVLAGDASEERAMDAAAAALLACALAEMRARSDEGASLGSLFVLMDLFRLLSDAE